MDQERLLRELSESSAFPSVSTLPAHNQDCRAAAEWVAAELRRLGCRDVEFLGSDTHPVVSGKGPDVPGAPTLIIYGHYDVQPPDPLASGPTHLRANDPRRQDLPAWHGRRQGSGLLPAQGDRRVAAGANQLPLP